MQPDTKYVAVDGARIAYQAFGVDSPALVETAGSFSHTDGIWEEPAAALFLTRLSSFARVIRYDHLGTSNSDPYPPEWDQSWRGYAAELDAVLAASGTEHVSLMATLDAGPVAIGYAAAHPERVSKLILVNTAARFLRGDGYPFGFTDEQAQELFRVFDSGWGDQAPLLRLNVPSKVGDERFAAWFGRYARMIGTPSTMTETLARALALDTRDQLARVTQPTLILHRTDYQLLLPIEHGRYLAEHIPHARLVELPGVDGPVYWETPDLIMDPLRSFLADGANVPRAGRALLTVLFTDIVRSTERASAMGDRDWNAVLRVHNDLAISEVSAASGRLVKFTGDGMLATFGDPGQALECALQLQTALARMGVTIRAGLHTGQVNVSASDVDGLAVHIAAWVMAAGGDGHVVVSRTVHDLLLGSPFRFASLGAQALKGIEGQWELFETQA